MSVSQYVNVFHGCGDIDLPKPEGIAATWYFIKAQCGNTFPHAALPFGKMSCGTYSGGYTTGYGENLPNSCGKEIPKLRPRRMIRGFSHLHQSGTGAIGMYYNFAVTTPMYGVLRSVEEEAKDEIGRPGYYAVTYGESGIFAEATVARSTAFHRYKMNGAGLVSVDFSNDGLDRSFGDRYYGLARNARVARLSDTELTAEVTMQGVPMYFYAVCPESTGAFLWKDYKETEGNVLTEDATEARFGGAFRVNGDCDVRVTLSLVSLDHARSLAKTDGADFDAAKERAEQRWEKYLSAIEIEADERTKRIFYSNLYHTLVKPCDLTGESFHYGEGEFMCDLATMWDMYKTQLPLVFTLYRDESEKVLATFARLGRKYDRLPVNVTLTNSMNVENQQARMIMEHSVADGFYRGVKADYGELLEVARRDLASSPEFASGGRAERWTHHLDMAEACGAMAELAHRLGDAPTPFDRLSGGWRQAFDTESGLLRSDSVYYEGNLWNYSFRLLRKMRERVALTGGEEKFAALLDRFFGYGAEPVERPREYNCWSYVDTHMLDRFEGYNNEPDMETPYAYLWINRPERTREILHLGRKYMFCEGEGGLPGNNDSGGLSSCYIWNALGIFPVSGQNLILFGLPAVENALLRLSNGKKLKICVRNFDPESIEIRKITFNGRPIENNMMTVEEMMRGGLIEFEM